MDEDLFDKGLQKRCETLGREYVERNLKSADAFRPHWAATSRC